jgi:hypothetical protein
VLASLTSEADLNRRRRLIASKNPAAGTVIGGKKLI